MNEHKTPEELALWSAVVGRYYEEKSKKELDDITRAAVALADYAVQSLRRKRKEEYDDHFSAAMRAVDDALKEDSKDLASLGPRACAAEGCKEEFISSNPKRLFHDKSCRDRDRQKRYRSKAK